MAALPVLRSFLSLYTINKVKSQSTKHKPKGSITCSIV